MSAGFTPGPWDIDGLSLIHGPDHTRGGQRVTIANAVHNAAANARLIAAAPELYEALMMVSRDSGKLSNMGWQQVERALAKARGEQQ